MASKDINNRFKDEKLHANTVIWTADMSATSSLADEIGIFCTPPISRSYQYESTTTSERQSKSELSRMLSSIVLENWGFTFLPTPKETIESILGDDSAECSTNEAEKKELNLKSSHFQDVVAQKRVIGSNAATESRKKKPMQLRDPLYKWVNPDARVLSDGFVAVSEAPMASEYDELWKETYELIQSEYIRLER